MWKTQIIHLDNGTTRWEVIHENGKRGTCVAFTTLKAAQECADQYNKDLGFCPDCGITQYHSFICNLCAIARLEKNGVAILKGRVAKCYCNKSVESEKAYTEKQYAFFQYNPNKENDIWYCGCKGWD